jgi:hypothetical protein
LETSNWDRSSINNEDLEAFTELVGSFKPSGLLYPELMKAFRPKQTRKSQAFASAALGILLDNLDSENNWWLRGVLFFGDDAALLAAGYASREVMIRVLAVPGVNVKPINELTKCSVLDNALKRNKHVDTIKYLIDALFALRPDSISLKLHATLASGTLIQGEALKDFVSLLDPQSATERDITRMFIISTMFGQHLVLKYLFDQNFKPPIHHIITRASELDDKPTIKVLIGVCDDEHTIMLLRSTLKAGSTNSIPFVISGYFFRTAIFSDSTFQTIQDFLRLAHDNNNIIAWSLLAKACPLPWGILDRARLCALSANSVEYVKVLHNSGHLSLDDRNATEALKYAIRYGCYGVVLWIVTTFSPTIPAMLFTCTNPRNPNDPTGSIIFYLQRVHHICTMQELFDLMIKAGYVHIVKKYMEECDAELKAGLQQTLPRPLGDLIAGYAQPLQSVVDSISLAVEHQKRKRED